MFSPLDDHRSGLQVWNPRPCMGTLWCHRYLDPRLASRIKERRPLLAMYSVGAPLYNRSWRKRTAGPVYALYVIEVSPSEIPLILQILGVG